MRAERRPGKNPLLDDPAIAGALEALASGIGQPLAVYAVARARAALDDPLGSIGTPLIDVMLKTVGERPVSVTSMRTTSGNGLEHWSLIVTFDGGLRASIDVGSGLVAGQTTPLDLRIEWSGVERAILVEPANVAVTVTNGSGASTRTAEVNPIAALLTAGSWDATDAAYWGAALAVEAAARRSLATNVPVAL